MPVMTQATSLADLDFVQPNAPLARLTWYRIGGPARFLARPQSLDDLAELVKRCAAENLPLYVLGLGANLLVSDAGVDGVVVRLEGPHWERVEINGTTVTANAGVDLQKLLLQTVRAGLAGIETLAGIPATVGGAARMNAGGKYGDFGNAVRSLTVMDAEGNVYDRTRDDLIWEYRRVNVVAPLILSATLELEADDPDALARRMKEVWMFKRNTQPLNTKSAGCIFKNPPGQSAGALIDRAGLKGSRVGGAEVSDKHANFVIAHPGCTSADVEELVGQVRLAVLDHSGVELEPEVKRWP